ncbi:MAG TPA: MarR family winged helix-turn-helix transcriptional regulator, partial [Gemmatimonadales bacterium]|nr:MarR family winged helix-turn-helix transcriptional regulator [Gemmatimonadales bacterium]
MDPDQVAQVRRFNRLVIQRAGGLYEHFLGRARPLGASRVLYAIGYESSHDGADLRDLRARLGLDSGYLTRLVQSLEKEGLVKVRPGPGDERVRTAVLTRAGKAEVAEIDRRSDESASSILEPLTPAQRERLVAAQQVENARLIAATKQRMHAAAQDCLGLPSEVASAEAVELLASKTVATWTAPRFAQPTYAAAVAAE